MSSSECTLVYSNASQLTAALQCLNYVSLGAQATGPVTERFHGVAQVDARAV